MTVQRIDIRQRDLFITFHDKVGTVHSNIAAVKLRIHLPGYGYDLVYPSRLRPYWLQKGDKVFNTDPRNNNPYYTVENISEENGVQYVMLYKAPDGSYTKVSVKDAVKLLKLL